MGVQNVLDKGVNASNLGRSIVQPFLRICGTKDAASFSVNDWKDTEWVVDNKATLRDFVREMGVFEVDSDNIIVGYIPRKGSKTSTSKPVSGIGMDQVVCLLLIKTTRNILTFLCGDCFFVISFIDSFSEVSWSVYYYFRDLQGL